MKFLTVNERPEHLTRMTSSAGIAKEMASVGKMDRESVWVIHLDARLQVISKEMVTLGLVNASLLHPREIFRRAIIEGSSAIIMVHNHPSGDDSPSNEDLTITKQIREAAKIIGIDFLDHIIVTPHAKKYFSFADRGIL